MLRNQLSKSTSPYLLQHKDNPVHWQEWSDEVLQMAKNQNKCLLISVGYSACHWCHVMAHESFEDEKVAEIMNTHFINIKIDREERPDIDQIYMEAAQILTGRGGWPLNAFALPDGKPFYAGTYFPKDNWKMVLKNIAEAYSEQPDKLVKTAERLTEGLSNEELIFHHKDNSAVSEEILQNLYQDWFNEIDFDFGGQDKAPKFPMPCIWESLLEYQAVYNDQKALRAVEITLDQMYSKGIYDWLGGGFARYSVDEYWFAPHFEKMLYDNAQLLALYANAYKLTRKPTYKNCIDQCIQFIQEEMKSESIGYFTALDADTEGEEGKFYTWTYTELKSILSEIEFEIAIEFFNLKPQGNWEDGRNILSQHKSKTEIEDEFIISKSEVEKYLSSIKRKLKLQRDKRIAPGIDFKCITAHNAMLVFGFTKAFQATQQKEYKTLAIDLMNEITDHAIDKNYNVCRLMNKPDLMGFLDDYAFCIKALIEVYQITFEIKYIKCAERLLDVVLKRFYDHESKLFYYTSDNSKLIVRKKEISDNVVPSSNAIMAENLWVTGHLVSNMDYLETSKLMVKKVEPLFKAYKMYFATWYKLKLAELRSQTEIAITGKEAIKSAEKLQQNFFPISHYYGGNEENLPQLQHKIKPNQVQFFVCKHQSCSKPLTNKNEFKSLLTKIEF
jgi:uncharacterized protein YyaL (SSP411 family)